MRVQNFIKIMKKTCCLALLLSLTLMCARSIAGKPVFLRVNQCYVLYTNPVVPFVDEKGNLIVSVQAFANLIGATSKADLHNGTYFIQLAHHTLILTAGSNLASIDGRSIKMPEAARKVPPFGRTEQDGVLHLSVVNLISEVSTLQILAPANLLARAFGIPLTWDAASRTVSLTKEELMPEINGSLWAEDITRFETPNTKTRILIPLAIRLLPQTNLSSPRQLKFSMRNISGHDLPENAVFLNKKSDGGPESGPNLPLPDTHGEPPAMLKAGGTRSILVNMNGPNTYYFGWAVCWPAVRDYADSSVAAPQGDEVTLSASDTGNAEVPMGS